MTDLHARAAALLAACDKMTQAPWHLERDQSHYDSLTHIASSTGIGAGLIHADAAMETDAYGIVALRNEAPALIRELLEENERLQVTIYANTSTIAADDSLYRGNSVRYWYDKLTARTAENERLRARVAELEESLHMANGTADLAMKHRDMAEKRVAELESGLHNIVSHWLEVGGPMATRGAIFAIARRSLGDAMPDTAAVDVGPTPFQGRKTRRNEE